MTQIAKEKRRENSPWRNELVLADLRHGAIDAVADKAPESDENGGHNRVCGVHADSFWHTAVELECCLGAGRSRSSFGSTAEVASQHRRRR
jgi:hypothetical protein